MESLRWREISIVLPSRSCSFNWVGGYHPHLAPTQSIITGYSGSAHPAPLTRWYSPGPGEHPPIVPQHHVILLPLMDIGQIRPDGVRNDLAQDGVSLLVLHPLDRHGMPRRDVEDFPIRRRLGVHKRVDYAFLY